MSPKASTRHRTSEPFIGPQPFTSRERDIFFGRDGETQEILSLILSNQEILIYAQSGAGKTSIINAKIMPELERYGMQLLPTARVRSTIEQNTATGHIKNVYIFNTLLTLRYLDVKVHPSLRAAKNLNQFLSRYPRKRNSKNRITPRIIIFDQFEELFTTYVKGWPRQREAFFRQLGDALNADPLLKIVFIIREEYLAQLEKYCSFLPDRLRTRFHLELLRREAAISAVEKPLSKFNYGEVARYISKKIVDDLLKSKVEDVFGEVVETRGEFVEPVHLQVVCQRVWRRGIPSDPKIISEKTIGSVDEALEEFYSEIVEASAEKTGIDEKLIRRWCEKKLITSSGTRAIVHRGLSQTAEISNRVVDELEKRLLIRKEQRSGASWYELTHDRFLKPLRDSNKKWEKERWLKSIPPQSTKLVMTGVGLSLRVGYVSLGHHGAVAGSVRQQVYDGKTIVTKMDGNIVIRFLGIDTPEISFQLPGRSEFLGLSNELWTEFLSDPFASEWQQPPMDDGLVEYLKQKTGQDTATNHHKHAVLAESALESEIANDMEKLGQTNEDFQFFLAFADEIMDSYGRLLSYVNRNQPIETSQPRPRPYNERLLEHGVASPYFIFPNVSPFYNNKLEDNIELSPVEFRKKTKLDKKLQIARESVRKAREDEIGMFDKDDPLKMQGFEIRFLAQRRLPNRYVIDLSKDDNILINPQKYYLINLEDRMYIPYRYVPLFVDSGWKQESI